MPQQIEIDADFLEMKKTPSYAEFIHWKQIQERKLVINDGIDEFIVEEYIMPILRWNEEDEGKEITGREPITIYLNTPGGEVFNGLVLAEIIKKSKTPVHIVALAFAASMGSVILASGHNRKAYKYSNVLIHDGDVGAKGSSNKVKDTMKFLDKKHDQLKDFYIANTKITEEKFDSMADREWWMTAEEALELGIIDEIIQ